MANYDHDVIGVGNSQHPANQVEIADNAPADLYDALNTAFDDLTEESKDAAFQMCYDNAKLKKEILDLLDHNPNMVYLRNKIAQFK